MDNNILKAHLDAEQEERKNKPWYIRISLDMFDYIYYRLVLR